MFFGLSHSFVLFFTGNNVSSLPPHTDNFIFNHSRRSDWPLSAKGASSPQYWLYLVRKKWKSLKQTFVSLFCIAALTYWTKCKIKQKEVSRNPWNKLFNLGGSSRSTTGGQAEPGRHKQARSWQKPEKSKMVKQGTKRQARLHTRVTEPPTGWKSGVV